MRESRISRELRILCLILKKVDTLLTLNVSIFMKKKSEFSAAERERIVREYLTGSETAHELSLKYGIKGKSTLSNWVVRLQKSKKSTTFAPSIQPPMVDEVPMKKQTPLELEAEIKRLTRELEWAKLQNKALNTMIDIAESQGIQIRKKSGAKQ